MSSTTTFTDAVAAIVRANIRRFVNQRSSLFFVVALPLLLVVALALTIGSDAPTTKLGVIDQHPSAASTAILQRIDGLADIDVRRYDDVQAMRDDLARRAIDVGWVADTGAETTTLTWYSSLTGNDYQLRGVVEAQASLLGLHAGAIQVVAADAGVDPGQAKRAIDDAVTAMPATAVTTTPIKGENDIDQSAVRAVLAGGELTLFIFLSTVAGASYLLTSRQIGVTRRTMAAPVTASALIAGEALSRIIIAIFQALVVLIGSLVLFGIDWSAPVAVGLLCLAMALVGAGVAMILGTVSRSAQQVGAMAIFGSLVLAALGGSLRPLHFFPAGLRTVALAVTPHAWMNDALWKILVDGGGLADIWLSLVVLISVGIALLSIASALMRRHLRA
ncbi:MAG TPA: ABC transporter permease [Ilumatobacteraceae bacterium]|nr:ABC transporter permease [Ilumatobacteraceae bacterium]